MLLVYFVKITPFLALRKPIRCCLIPWFFLFFLYYSFLFGNGQNSGIRVGGYVLFSFLLFFTDGGIGAFCCLSCLVDWSILGAAKYMHQKPSQRKLLLLLSLFGNLGGLSVFKYSAFFAGLIDTAFAAFGWSINCVGSLPEWSLVVPVGISFYTFQSMSYTIDVYRSNLKPVKSVLHFFAYLSMFPQLVAGPIVRAKDMLRQLAENRRQTSLGYWLGFKLIVYGIFSEDGPCRQSCGCGQQSFLGDRHAALRFVLVDGCIGI